VKELEDKHTSAMVEMARGHALEIVTPADASSCLSMRLEDGHEPEHTGTEAYLQGVENAAR
jgi:hypothetical protein